MASEGKGVSVDTEVWLKVLAVCDRENRSLSNAVETLLKEALRAREEKSA